MGKTETIVIAFLIFALFIFLYWRLSHKYLKRKYDIKAWKNGASRLSYWQGAVLYSVGFTVLTLFLLKWGNVLSF